MTFINAVSIAPDAGDWLTTSSHSRILHVFDHVCNLINERREVLSIVTQQTGNGPFNLVVEDDILFSDHLDLRSPISHSHSQLNLGNLTINITNAKLWSPRPDWERLHAQRDNILNQLISFPIINYQLILPHSLISNLCSAIVIADISSTIKLTSKLAGLGNGLTPAGDDFIMGAILATWIIHPLKTAGILAREITNAAAPLTTSLSGAWLRSAGRGEAGILWHNLFEDLISAEAVQIQTAVNKILAVGETSGADALSGFVKIFMSWRAYCSKSMPENSTILSTYKLIP